MNMANEGAAVRGLIDAFVNAWNAADSEALARPFAEDADFTAIQGLKARGRESIARGRSEILAIIYKGAKLSAAVESVGFLPDVAVADVAMESQNFPFGLRRTLAGPVEQRLMAQSTQ